MWYILNSFQRHLAVAVDGIGSGPSLPQQLGNIQKMTAKVAADGQDTKINDQKTFTQLQTAVDSTLDTKDTSTITTSVRSELAEAKGILDAIKSQGGKVTPDQIAKLKELSEKILVDIQQPNNEVKWGTLNVKIKDDDTRYKYLKENPAMFLLPDGGMQDKGVVKATFPNKEPVPTLSNAIYEDLQTVRGKFSSPADLQKGIENGFGTKLSDADAKVLFDFIEKGSIGGSGKVSKEDVGKLQKILGSISPHFEQRLATNGKYDSKYGYATTEEVRLLAAQMAKKVPEPTKEIEQTKQTTQVQVEIETKVEKKKNVFKDYDEVMIVMDKSPSMSGDRKSVAADVKELLGDKNIKTKVGLTFFEDTKQTEVKSKIDDNNRDEVISQLLNAKHKEKSPDESGLNGALKALKKGGFSDDPDKTRLLRIYTDEFEHDASPEKLLELQDLAKKKGIKIEIVAIAPNGKDPNKVIQLDDAIKHIKMDDGDKGDKTKAPISDKGNINWRDPRIPGELIAQK